MTKKEKKQLEKLLARMEMLREACYAKNALCKHADGAYTHNAMVVLAYVVSLLVNIEKSINNDTLLISDIFD